MEKFNTGNKEQQRQERMPRTTGLTITETKGWPETNNSCQKLGEVSET